MGHVHDRSLYPIGVLVAGNVSTKDIWDALINAGASSAQAAGIMGNMQYESSFNVETGLGGHAIDSNGYPVYGLVSWNAASYPNASALVTGNPAQDLINQVKFLVQSGGLRAASGSTAAQTGGNFAANYEKCQGCQAGGSQYNMRSSAAVSIFSDAQSGKWPSGSGSPSQGGGGGGGGGPTTTGFDLNPFSWAGDLWGSLWGGFWDAFQKVVVSTIETTFWDIVVWIGKYIVGGAELISGPILMLIGIAILALVFGSHNAAGVRAAGALVNRSIPIGPI